MVPDINSEGTWAAIAMAVGSLVGLGKIKQKVEDHEKCLDRLSGMPEIIGRIDERVKAIHDRLPPAPMVLP